MAAKGLLDIFYIHLSYPVVPQKLSNLMIFDLAIMMSFNVLLCNRCAYGSQRSSNLALTVVFNESETSQGN